MRILALNLPGIDLVKRGLEDLSAQHQSKYSMLLLSAKSRLNDLGISFDNFSSEKDPSGMLFSLLKQEQGDGAHSMYNALNRELLSFIKALEHETRS